MADIDRQLTSSVLFAIVMVNSPPVYCSGWGH